LPGELGRYALWSRTALIGVIGIDVPENVRGVGGPAVIPQP